MRKSRSKLRTCACGIMRRARGNWLTQQLNGGDVLNKAMEYVNIGWLGNWSVRSYHIEEQRRQLECAMSASKCPTPVVRASVCSKHFGHA